MDLRRGRSRPWFDVPFQMGHIQAESLRAGRDPVLATRPEATRLSACGSRAATAPGTGPYIRKPRTKWVTHEAWVDKDHVYFVIMAHELKLRTKPTGLVSINVRTDEVRVLGQVDVKGTVRGRDGLVDARASGHCNGSPDGKWAVGDTFAGNVYLIYVPTGEITLLTAAIRTPRTTRTRPSVPTAGRS